MRAPKGRTNQPSRRVSTWLPPYLEDWLRLEALRRVLAAEEQESRAGDDDDFRGKIQAVLEGMGLPIPKPSWDDVKNLREALKRKNLGQLFPNARQRQIRTWSVPIMEDSVSLPAPSNSTS